MTRLPLETGPVVPRYPGSKRLHALRYLRLKSPYAVVEPFLGAGYFSLYSQSPQKWVAEADYGLRSLWELWYEGMTGAIVREVRRLQTSRWKTDPEEEWRTLKERWYSPANRVRAAAIALLVRKLSQNGVVRCNKEGRLNITAVESQIPLMLEWTPKFPPVVGAWHIFDSAEGCVKAFNSSGCGGNAAALIDPPYYRPRDLGARRGTGTMTPAYPGHRPNDPETLRLMADPIYQLCCNPAIEWIAGTNYHSQEMDDAVADAVDRSWLKRSIVDTRFNGSLDSMNGKGWSDRGSKVVDPVAQLTIWGESEKGQEIKEKVSECPKAIEVEYWIE